MAHNGGKKHKRRRPNGQRTAKPRRKSKRFVFGVPKALKTIPEFRRLIFG